MNPFAIGRLLLALEKILNLLKKADKGVGALVEAMVDLYNYAHELSKDWGKFDEYAKRTSRNMGLAYEQAEQMRSVLIDSQLELGKIYNLSAEDLAKFNAEVTEAYGRVALLSQEAIENFAALKLLVPESAIKGMVEEMDAFGTSLETSMAYLSLTRAQAQKLGLNTNKATDALSKNVKALSKYGFKQGITDIQTMTLWSQRLKANFDSIASATKNFNTIQGSIENSAKIQMLGGALAYNYANPLEVMSEAMFDTKSFGERIADTVSNMGTFDKRSGTVRVESWLDRAKIQQYADAVGVSYEELLNMANQQAKYKEIDRDISRNLTEEQRQAVANMAQFNADTQRWEIVDANKNRYDVASIDNEQMLDKIASNTVSKDRDTNIKNIAGHVSEIASWVNGDARQLTAWTERDEGRKKTREAAKAKATEALNVPEIVESISSTVTDILSNISVMKALLLTRMALTVASGLKSGWKKGGTKTILNMLSKNGFEHGGIIGGSYPTGDQLLARVNSEEMILTKEQQAQLFNIANGAMPIAVSAYSEQDSGGDMGGWFRRSASRGTTSTIQQNTTVRVRSGIVNKLEKVFGDFTEAQKKTWSEFISKEGELFGRVKNTRVWQGASQRISSVRNVSNNAVSSVSKGFTTIGTHIKEIATDIKNSRISQNVRELRSNVTNFSRIRSGVANSRFVTTMSRYGGNVINGTKAVFNPVVDFISGSAPNTKNALGSVYRGVQNRVGFSAIKNTAKGINSKIGQSVVGKASKSLASKGVTKIAGRLVKGGGPAALASLAVDGANMLGTHLGWWDEGSNTAKGMNVVGDTLGYAATGAMIGSFIPVIGNAVGGLVGGAIGLTKSLYENFGDEIKGFFVGKNNMSEADVAQQQYEQTKFGASAIEASMAQDPSGENMKVLAAQATVKMHDILVSIWNRLNGLQSNGEKADNGVLGKVASVTRFLFGAPMAAATTIASSAISTIPTAVPAANSFIANMENEDHKDYTLENAAYKSTVEILAILKGTSPTNVSTAANSNVNNVSYSNVNNENIRNANARSAFASNATYNGINSNVYSSVTNEPSTIGVKTSDVVNPMIQSVPVVGAPTVIIPSYDFKVDTMTKPLDVNLNVNGSIKLDASALGGKDVNIDINKLLENSAVKQKIIDIIMSEFTKVNGKTAKNSAFSKTGNMLLGFSQMQ